MKNQFTGIKVVGILVISVALLFYVYLISTKSLNRLITVVHDASQPDELLMKLNHLKNDLTHSESSIRAFTVTRKEEHLLPFLSFQDQVSEQLDSIRLLAISRQFNLTDIDSIAALVHRKVSVYKELLLINYSGIYDSSMVRVIDKVTDSANSTDTLSSQAPKKKLFPLFGGRKKLQEQLDSAYAAQKAVIEKADEARRNINTIKAQHDSLLKDLKQKELALIQKDENINEQLEHFIREVEMQGAVASQQKADTSMSNATVTAGTVKWIVISGLVLIFLLLVMVLSDLIKNRQYRKQLAEARLQAEKMAQAKELFLATMSHEIRTPLTTITGYAGQMSKTPLSEKQKIYSDNILRATDHLLAVVNDILDLTRIETGKIVFEKSVFSPCDVLREVCEVMKIKASEKNIQLVQDVSQISKIHVTGDSMRLRQVLFNLIGNAVKFTEQGAITVSARSEQQPESQESGMVKINFSIRDTGIGMAPAQLKTIFDPFRQADKSTARLYGGSGLGLSISKKIIEQAGGGITVRSERGKGSVFSFFIPYEPAAAEVNTAVKKPEQVSLSSSLSGVHILLAEDVEINRQLQAGMLHSMGARVDAFENGLDLLAGLKKLLRQENPGTVVVLLDERMPGMSGTETMREIRNSISPSLPVIAVTADALHGNPELFRNNGFTDCILKPYTEAEIAQVILKHLPAPNHQHVLFDEPVEVVLDDPPFSLESLHRSSNGNTEFVIRMLKLFLHSTGSILAKAVKAAEEKNYEALSAHAHKLIPSCRQLSISKLADRLKKVEESCSQRLTWEEIKSDLEYAEKIFERISGLLQQEIETLQKSKVIKN